MKVKNVIKGLLQKYDLQEINIISPAESKVYFSGPPTGWKETEVDLIPLKRKIENTEVVEKLMFNGKKAFIFISPLDCFYPTKLEDNFEPITHFFQD